MYFAPLDIVEISHMQSLKFSYGFFVDDEGVILMKFWHSIKINPRLIWNHPTEWKIVGELDFEIKIVGGAV